MTEGSFGLTVQGLTATEQVLVLGHVAGWRGQDAWFSTGDVSRLYLALRIPEPANISATLGRLRDNTQFIRDRPSSGGGLRWATTPRGEQRAEQLVGDFDYSTIAVELENIPGAHFATTKHSTLPPAMAPPPWARPIAEFLEDFPFERNVFLMTRFPRSGGDDPLSVAIPVIRDIVEEHGLNLLRADEHQIVDNIWGNVGAHMWASRFGVGLLETLAPAPEGDHAEPSTLNDNVLIELGSMLTIGRRCMILRDPRAPMPPTDLTAQIFKPIPLEDSNAVSRATALWIENDLRI